MHQRTAAPEIRPLRGNDLPSRPEVAICSFYVGFVVPQGHSKIARGFSPGNWSPSPTRALLRWVCLPVVGRALRLPLPDARPRQAERPPYHGKDSARQTRLNNAPVPQGRQSGGNLRRSGRVLSSLRDCGALEEFPGLKLWAIFGARKGANFCRHHRSPSTFAIPWQ